MALSLTSSRTELVPTTSLTVDIMADKPAETEDALSIPVLIEGEQVLYTISLKHQMVDSQLIVTPVFSFFSGLANDTNAYKSIELPAQTINIDTYCANAGIKTD